MLYLLTWNGSFFLGGGKSCLIACKYFSNDSSFLISFIAKLYDHAFHMWKGYFQFFFSVVLTQFTFRLTKNMPRPAFNAWHFLWSINLKDLLKVSWCGRSWLSFSLSLNCNKLLGKSWVVSRCLLDSFDLKVLLLRLDAIQR